MKYLLILLFAVSCGTEETNTRTEEVTVEPCSPEVVVEVIEGETVTKEVVKVVEVVKQVAVPTDTPLFFTGQFCGRTVLEHDGTHYLVHSQLMPILKDQAVVISNSCKIKFKDGVVREVKS